MENQQERRKKMKKKKKKRVTTVVPITLKDMGTPGRMLLYDTKNGSSPFQVENNDTNGSTNNENTTKGISINQYREEEMIQEDWEDLVSQWQFPSEHSKDEFLHILKKLFQLKYQDKLANLASERDYYKEKYHKSTYKKTPLVNTKAVQQFEKIKQKIQSQLLELQEHAKHIEKLREDLIHFETDTDSMRQLIESFCTQHTQNTNDMLEKYNQIRIAIDATIKSYHSDLNEKHQEYEELKGKMQNMMNKMRDHMEAEKVKEETNNVQSAELLEAQTQNQRLQHHIKALELKISQQFQQIQQWKDISLLTIPLVDLVNHTMYHKNEQPKQKVTTKPSTPKKQPSSPIPQSVPLSPITIPSQPSTPQIKAKLHVVPSPEDETNVIRISLSHPRDENNTEEIESLATSPTNSLTLKTRESTPRSPPFEPITPTSTINLQPAIPTVPPHIIYFEPFKKEYTIIGKPNYSGHRDGLYKRACFNLPNDLCMEKQGVFVLESGNTSVRKFNIPERIVSTVKLKKINSKTKKLENFQLQGPISSSYNPEKKVLYILDHVVHMAKNKPQLFAFDGKKIVQLAIKNFSKYEDIRTCYYHTPSKSLFVAFKSGILQIDLKQKSIKRIIGHSLECGFADGKFENARFSQPNGFCALDRQLLLLADSNNHLIRLIDLKRKKVSTLSGTLNVAACCDGPVASACFNRPVQVAYCPPHFVFVTEQHQHIRMINLYKQSVSTIKMDPALVGASGLVAFPSNSIPSNNSFNLSESNISLSSSTTSLNQSLKEKASSFAVDHSGEIPCVTPTGSPSSLDDQTPITLIASSIQDHILVKVDIILDAQSQ